MQRSKRIGGVVYEFRPMDPELLLEDAGKLGAVLAPAFEKGADLMKDDADGMTGLATLLGAVLRQMDKPEIMKVVKDLMSTGTANGVELEATWKTHFLGKTKDMMAVIAFFGEGQFGDFFGDWRGKIAQKLAKSASASPDSPVLPESPSPST